MIFQTLDDKRHCAGYYADGKLHYDAVPSAENLTGTWGFNPHILSGVRYAQVYANGKSLDQVCPDSAKKDWEQASAKMKAFLRSFQESGVSLAEHCFYDLVPERPLMDYCEVKNIICQHVFDNYEKPKNYNFLSEVGKVISQIERRPLNINLDNVSKDLSKPSVLNYWKKVRGTEQTIKYNLFGTKTGRLSTFKNSFPIHTLGREARRTIEPTNDFLVELDFNAAELRTLLALSEQPQPAGDIHEWNIKNIFKGPHTREEAKKKIFAWLYNPKRKNAALENIYNREDVVQRYFNGSQVNTVFHRTIPADHKHALNYIIQSTTSDLLLDRLVAVSKMIEDKKSFVAFCIHDNLVLDMKADECYIVPELANLFSKTLLGEYKVNMRVGKNFGEMKEIDLWTQ